MIFAAGFGTRMQPLTHHRPKPLISVAGQTLIDRTLDLAVAAEPSCIVVNAHYKAEMLVSHLSKRDVTTVVETPDILDTGGGLKNALPKLGSNPVITSNSDAIWMGANPFLSLLEAWDPEKMDALLVCIPLERCVGRTGGGDFQMHSDGRLDRTGDYVFGGIQILKTDRLNHIEERAFSLNRVWDAMHAENRLFGITYTGHWCDIGTPEGISLAENLMAHDADE